MPAIIFDFDGTLVDTESPEYEAWKETFASYGCDLPLEEWAYLLGRGANEEHERPAAILARLTGRPEVEALEHARQRERIVERIWSQPLREGVSGFLTRAEQEGVKLGIASSSRHDWVDPLLRHHQIDRFFQAVICVGDVERGKPQPDTYLRAAELLGEEVCVAVEDSPNGIRGAKAAGLFTVAFPNSVTRQLDLSLADWTVETFEGLSADDLFRQRNAPSHKAD